MRFKRFLLLLMIPISLFLLFFTRAYAMPDYDNNKYLVLDGYFVSYSVNTVFEYNVTDRDNNFLYEMDIFDYEVTYRGFGGLDIDATSVRVLYNTTEKVSSTLSNNLTFVSSSIYRSNTNRFTPYGLTPQDRQSPSGNVRVIGDYAFTVTSNFSNEITLVLRTNLQLNESQLRAIMPDYLSVDYYDSLNDWWIDMFNFSGSDYQRGYNQGYTDGKADGIEQSFELGFGSGYEIGYNEGYLVGYDKGVAGDTWSTLFSAVLAPFQLLNLEILPGLKLGAIAAIPIVFGIIGLLFNISRAHADYRADDEASLKRQKKGGKRK